MSTNSPTLWRVVPWLVLATACGTDPAPAVAEPAKEATPAASVPAPKPAAAQANRVMGTGEARNPEPFTHEMRFLQAAREADLATLARAMELGVSVDAKDDLGRAAIALAARDAGSLEAVQWLAAREAEVDAPDVRQRTALSFAAERGRLEIVRFLADAGAATDAADADGRTPLYHAAIRNRIDIATFLLDAGADPNPRDNFQDTPLILACAKGLDEMAKLLVARGADRTLRDQEGRSAADRAKPGADYCLSLQTREG